MLATGVIDEARALVRSWNRSGETLALVPTMGNLHDGHLCLIDEARRLGSKIIVSIFVNPTQFVQGEDFETYPRTLARDKERIATRSVDLLFVPGVSEIYCGSGLTTVNVSELSGILCGEFRPGHFQGVATVVCKLFNIIQPQVAVFGKKDYQQLQVIRVMVEDLNIPVAIHGVDTVREHDGLALSSRNIYLNTAERRIAPLLFRNLFAARDRILNGEREFGALECEMTANLCEAGFNPEYFRVRRAEDLLPAGPDDIRLVVLAAAHLGNTRLIDNLQFSLPPI